MIALTRKGGGDGTSLRRMHNLVAKRHERVKSAGYISRPVETRAHKRGGKGGKTPLAEGGKKRKWKRT